MEPKDRALLLAASDRAIARGERRLREGDAPRARALAQRVLARDPDSLGALELLGKSALRLSEPGEALWAASRLLAINPYNPGYHSLRGLALQAQGLFAPGARALRRDPKARLALGVLEADQEVLVADLAKTDPSFARRLAASPNRTLREEGFFVR